MEYRIPKELMNKGDIEDKISDVVQGKMKEAKEEVKKFLCEDCGRGINHRGKCFACNIKAKKNRKE